jgi:Tol biopolymer transport system component
VLQTISGGKPQLWSVPLDGSSMATLLHDPSTWDVNSSIRTRVSASGEWLAFSVPVSAPQLSPLRVVRTDASAAALVLGPESSEGSFEFAGATDTLVFKESSALFSAPCNGSSAPIQLVSLAPGHALESFLISPDGAYTTYLDLDTGTSTRELYSVPTSGGTAVKLNATVTATASGVSLVLIDPSSEHAFFWLDELGDGAFDLFRSPLDGSTASVAIASGMDRPHIQPRASDEHVVFLSSLQHDLFGVPADGATPPIALNVELLKGSRLGDVTRFLYSPDRSSLVYLADAKADGAFDLFLVALPSGEPTALTDLAPFGRVDQFSVTFTPDSSQVVFLARDQVGYENELFSVPLDGSGAPTKLSLDQFVRSEPMVSSDGTKVAYRAGSIDFQQLYVAPIDASAPPLELNDALASNRSVTHATLSKDGSRVLYRVDQTSDDVFELYSVPLDASSSPVKLSGTIPATADVIDVRAAAGRAIYQCDQAVDGRFELYSAPDDGSGAPVKLNHALTASGTIQNWLLTPDGTRVVYRSRTSSSTKSNLYVVPSDGSTPPVLMSAHVSGDVGGFKISADSTHLAYQSPGAVWGSPIDASFPVVQLNPPLVAGGAIQSFEISPDATLVAYVATQENASTSEVYCAAIDTSTPAVKLNSTLVAGGDVGTTLRFAPDSRHLLFSADGLVDERFDLFWAPVGGGRRPVLVNPRLAPGRTISVFEVSPDGEDVLYLADLDENDVVELYASRVVNGPLRSGPP